MYCPNCGKEVEADDRFCKYCSFNLGDAGQRADPGPSPVIDNDDTKSTGLAMFLSVVFPGIGAYYIDNNTMGIIIFLISLIAAFGTVILFFPILVQIALWIYGLKITSDSIDDYRKIHPL